jgi:menaquinol-cytochrome c reductase iron-sulfur subunit
MNPSSDEPRQTANPQQDPKSRRAFLFKLSVLLNGVVGAVLAVPFLGYILGPALKKGSRYNSWVTLGSVREFPEGETRLADYRNPVTTPWDGQTGNVACWVRHISGEQFQIFAINCAHLGCPVRWFSQSKLFLCPCHGGAYYADGSRASGPPPRGLFEYEHRISGDQLMISAGEMPTLATESRVANPLIQPEGSPERADLAARRSSCQS